MSAPWSLSVAQRTLLETCMAGAQKAVPGDWIEFRLAGQAIGQMPLAHARAVAERLDDCQWTAGVLDWQVAGLTPGERSLLIERAAWQMREAGLIRGWRNELYACFPEPPGATEPTRELFRLERAAFRTFGLRSRAVHINGYRRDGCLWIGRRSADKAVDPGMLDNLAAGGLPAGEDPESCAVRELWEEAGIRSPLSEAIQAKGMVTTRRPVPEGLHHEDLYVFDLELPDGLAPVNIDGEVSSFCCMTVQAVVDALHAGAFTGDASVVTARFLLNRSLEL